jgi:hypothetical protein
VRSEREKWKVPESDPAGNQPIEPLDRTGSTGGDAAEIERAPLIYCGQCGALNPVGNHYCAACGATLLDAFHASEGLRVYERPDTASRLIEIVPTGNALDIVEDPDAPSDFVRVKISNGRLGYIRLADVEALAKMPEPVSRRSERPNINTRARGCVSAPAAIGALILLILIARLFAYMLEGEDVESSGWIAFGFCFVLTPLAFLIIAIYLWSNNREARLEEEEDEQANAADGN